MSLLSERESAGVTLSSADQADALIDHEDKGQFSHCPLSSWSIKASADQADALIDHEDKGQ